MRKYGFHDGAPGSARAPNGRGAAVCGGSTAGAGEPSPWVRTGRPGGQAGEARGAVPGLRAGPGRCGPRALLLRCSGSRRAARGGASDHAGAPPCSGAPGGGFRPIRGLCALHGRATAVRRRRGRGPAAPDAHRILIGFSSAPEMIPGMRAMTWRRAAGAAVAVAGGAAVLLLAGHRLVPGDAGVLLESGLPWVGLAAPVAAVAGAALRSRAAAAAAVAVSAVWAALFVPAYVPGPG